MRKMTICTIFISLSLIPLAAKPQAAPTPQPDLRPDAAQTSPLVDDTPTRPAEDWNRVRDLAHDEEINVWASHNRHVRCLFTDATEDHLFCEPRFPRQGSGEYHFDRTDVDKIRLEQGDRNFKATVGVGAAVGAITLAAATTTGKNGGSERLIAGLAGGLAGAFAGLIIAGPVAIFMPGHLVYERPRAAKTSRVRVHAPD